MARVLITGASGLLGANLVFSARPDDELIAVFQRHPIARRGVRAVSADLSQPGVADELFADLAPHWVVHCAAATDVDRCERETDWATRLNRDMAGAVASAAYAVGARLVHISTDAVYGDGRSPHAEDETPSPMNVYGRTKLEGEWAAMKAYPGAAVVRTNLFAWSAYAGRGLAAWFLDQLENARPCRGFTDVTFSPILANDLAGWLWHLLDSGLGGIFNLGGRTCLSKYEFGVKLAQAFGLDESLIQPAAVADGALGAARTRALCLDSSRIERVLESPLPTIDEGMGRLKAMAADGRRSEIEAMARVEAEET